MDNLSSMVVIIALVKVVKDYAPQQIHGVVTVLLAAGLGALAGYFGLEGLTVQSGVVAGLSAIGVHTVVKAVK